MNIFNEFTKLQIDLVNVERLKIDEIHRHGGVYKEISRKFNENLTSKKPV